MYLFTRLTKRKAFKSETRLSITYLPGQEVSLQLFACSYSPVQFWPPSAGTGLEQVLLLDCDPVPHVLLHVVQADQRLNPPFTKIKTVLILIELSGARSARSVAPWVRKFGSLCIQEILLLTKSFERTSTPSFKLGLNFKFQAPGLDGCVGGLQRRLSEPKRSMPIEKLGSSSLVSSIF